MSTYCDPLVESWEWHDADTWHRPKRERIERTDLLRSPGTILKAIEAPLDQEFGQLVCQWKQATENVSSLTQILSHPSYKRIIDLGRRGAPVVPLILRDLKERDGFWSSALRAITGENPVPAEHMGNAAKIRKDWLNWGKSRGYI